MNAMSPVSLFTMLHQEKGEKVSQNQSKPDAIRIVGCKPLTTKKQNVTKAILYPYSKLYRRKNKELLQPSQIPQMQVR